MALCSRAAAAHSGSVWPCARARLLLTAAACGLVLARGALRQAGSVLRQVEGASDSLTTRRSNEVGGVVAEKGGAGSLPRRRPGRRIDAAPSAAGLLLACCWLRRAGEEHRRDDEQHCPPGAGEGGGRGGHQPDDVHEGPGGPGGCCGAHGVRGAPATGGGPGGGLWGGKLAWAGGAVGSLLGALPLLLRVHASPRRTEGQRREHRALESGSAPYRQSTRRPQGRNAHSQQARVRNTHA